MIGSCILGAFEDAISAGVTSEWFWSQDCAYIWGIMERLSNDGKPVDEALVRFAVDKNGKTARFGPMIEMWIGQAGNKHNWKLWQDELHHALFRRTAFTSAHQLKAAAEDPNADIKDVAQNVDEALAGLRIEQTANQKTQRESVQDICTMISAVLSGNRDVIGLSTGFRDLDSIIGGLKKKNLVIIAGRPSAGKTAFACNIALNLAKSKVKVGIFSLEMGTDELNLRMAGTLGEVNVKKILDRKGTVDEQKKLVDSLKSLASLPVIINDKSGIPINYIRSVARGWVRNDVKAIFVDYLQLVHGSGSGRRDNMEQEVAKVSGGLKNMAKELDIPVIALCQMNRSFDKEPDRRPRLSDLRNSGAIEQDADSVIFRWKEGLAIEKNRHGPTGDVKLRWIPHFTKFESDSPEEAF